MLYVILVFAVCLAVFIVTYVIVLLHNALKCNTPPVEKNVLSEEALNWHRSQKWVN